MKRTISSQKIRVLIVDDDEYFQEVYQHLFEESGFEVQVISEGGLEAVKKALRFRPHLILLDLLMPHSDGYEFLVAFQARSDLRTKVVVCSNIIESESQQRALNIGAHYYWRKIDYTPRKLIREVQKILEVA